MTNELSTERAIEALYTVRAYYASLTAGYPKGKDRRGIGDVMCSEIANSCLMAIKALEQTSWIPVSERLPEKTDYYLIQYSREVCPDEMAVAFYSVEEAEVDSNYTWEFKPIADCKEVIAWMPLPQPYKAESEDKE